MVNIIHHGGSMSTLVLKGVSETLRKELKERALEHRRSVTQEAIVMLEQAVKRAVVIPPAKPFKLKTPLTTKEILAAIKEGRR
jgi:hypothetical protein